MDIRQIAAKAKKAEADTIATKAETFQTLADTEKTKAETMETLSKIDQSERENVVRTIEQLQNLQNQTAPAGPEPASAPSEMATMPPQ